MVTVGEALAGLPPLRSGISKAGDDSRWHAIVSAARDKLVNKLSDSKHFGDTARYLSDLEFSQTLVRQRPGYEYAKVAKIGDSKMPPNLARWLLDSNLETVLNHETRGHMTTDLERYLLMSAYSKVSGGKQITSDNMPAFLAPKHESWEKGTFKDRFKVQAAGKPSGTVTSHISKDGHHFIHPDPAQCRSFTVREAARLQTFPDNYFFTGNRTQQYLQVGNAVPPLLANQIAEIVSGMF